MSCERCRRCSPRCRSGSRSGRWSTASSSRWTSRRPISTPSSSAQVAAAQARRRVELGDVAGVVAGLRAAIETPLGPMAGGIALRDVGRADRLDELDFELPLVGGDDPSGPALTLAAIADVLRAHSEPGDPLAGYADRLLDPRLRSSVRGYLAGSIDLVLRLGGDRFAVVDYKTNWLAFPGEELTAWHHRPAALSAEMRHSHYGLQALLYTVALHRYLRWRLPGYSAERNLAGVLVPVHARDDGAGHAGRRRRAVRRVHLAAAGRARRGAERRPRLGGERVTGAVERDRFDIRLARGASGLLLAFNDAGVLAAADVHVAHAARRAHRRGGRSRGRWPPRSPCARRASGTSSSTSSGSTRRRPSTSTTRSTSRRCRGRSPPGGSRRWRRAGWRGRIAPCSSRAARSTSTATGARSSRSRRTSRRWPAPRAAPCGWTCSPPGSPGCSARTTSPTSASSRRPPRRCCDGWRSSPAGRAPARRRPSPGSSRCSRSRRRPPGSRPRWWRSPPRPERPPRGSPRRSTPRPRDSTSTTRSGRACSRSKRRPSTACSAGSPAPTAASATTAATASPTTS